MRPLQRPLLTMEEEYRRMGLIPTGKTKTKRPLVNEDGEIEDEDENVDEMSPSDPDAAAADLAGGAAGAAPADGEEDEPDEEDESADSVPNEQPISGAPAAAPAAAPMAAPTGKRAGMESKGNDRLELLMSELGRLTEAAGQFDTDKQRLIRIYTNVGAIADGISGRLHEEDVLGRKLDKLAEDSLVVAEGLRDGKITLAKGREAVKGYVKDLLGGINPVAEELDEELLAQVRKLRKKG